MLFYLYLLVQTIFGIWLWFYLERTFKKYKFLGNKDVMSNSKYPAFTRDDYPKWNKLQFFIFGFFFALPKLVMLVTSTIGAYLGLSFLAIVFRVKDYTKPQNPLFVKYVTLVMQIYCRFCLFCYGFLWISKKSIKANKSNMKNLKNVPDCDHSVLVSNHTTFIDIFYYASQGVPICYITNHMVKGYPIVGKVASTMQCIFLNRCNKSARTDCLQSMKQRIQNMKDHPKRKYICNYKRILSTRCFFRGRHD